MGVNKIALFFVQLLLFQDLAYSARTHVDSHRRDVVEKVETFQRSSTDAVSGGQKLGSGIVSGGQEVADTMKSYWTNIATKGQEAANQSLQLSMENPRMTLAIMTIIGGLAYTAYNYKAIWEYTKNAVKRIGSFIFGCFSVIEGAGYVILQLAAIYTISVIDRGHKPLLRNFCAEIMELLNNRITKAEVAVILEQLVAMNRVRDIQVFLNLATEVVVEEDLVPVPGPPKQPPLKVDVTGDMTDTGASELVKGIKLKIDFDSLPSNTDVIVPFKHSPEGLVVQKVDVIKPQTEGQQTSSDQIFRQETSRIGQENDGVLKITKPPPVLEPTKGLSKEVASVFVKELTTPAVPWYLLDGYIAASGRSGDRTMIEEIKKLASQYPVEYQARCLFIYGKHGWTGKFFKLFNTKDDKVADDFLRFYRSMVHAYFPRDPDTLQPIVNQEELRVAANSAFKDYVKGQRSLHPQPLDNMRLMEIYIELGHCLSPNCPQFHACQLARQLFDQLVDSNYEEIAKAKTPRLAFISKVKPVKESDIIRFLGATKSDLSILITAIRHLDVSGKVLAKFTPPNKAATLLFQEYAEKKGKPTFPSPCQNIKKRPGLFELKNEWKEAYETLNHAEQESFVKALIFLAFNIHPDDLPRFSILKSSLSDAINALVTRFCQVKSGTQHQHPTALAL